MMTSEQYQKSLKQLNLAVYMSGRKVNNVTANPLIQPALRAMAATYDLASNPEYEDIMTAISHITGQKINRFCHINQNSEDTAKKTRMAKLVDTYTGWYYQRCVGMNILNALAAITGEVDDHYGTNYNDRFNRYLKYVQLHDLTCDGAMIDPKIVKALPVSEQPCANIFIHVVEEKEAGIVVSWVKAHQKGAVNSHEIVAIPTVPLRSVDADYAIAFAVKSDAEGISYVIEQHDNPFWKLWKKTIDLDNMFYGNCEGFCIFDDVFVPWERVFLFKEHEFTDQFAEQFKLSFCF